MKSHLVSQVLLRQFTTSKKIKVIYKKTAKSDYTYTNNLAYFEFPDQIIKKTEEKWGRVETLMGIIYPSILNGSVLKNDRYIKTILDFMVIHYVRSPAFLELTELNEKKRFLTYIAECKKEFPERVNEINDNFLELRRQWVNDLILSFPKQFDSLIGKIKNHVYQYNLEIGVIKGKNKVVLSDNPVITITEDRKLGLINGAAITNSIGFILPLSPYHIAALIKEKVEYRYRELTNKEVRNINVKIKSQAINEYYSLPSIKEIDKFKRRIGTGGA